MSENVVGAIQQFNVMLEYFRCIVARHSVLSTPCRDVDTLPSEDTPPPA